MDIFTATIIVSIVIFVAIGSYAGRGVILTDTFMFLLFIVATFLVVVFIVNDLGGVPSAIEGMARLDEKPGILIAYGCIMPFVMLHWYVRPYQTGTGQLLPDGSINFATGEAFVTLTWAAIYIPLGIISAKVIRNSYSPGAKVRNSRFADDVQD